MAYSPVVGAADTAQLQRLLRALADADPQAYFDAANALEEAADRIEKVAELIQERCDRLFVGTGGGERWEGRAADAAQDIADALTRRLRKIPPLIKPWATEADSAGEAINNAWREVNQILAGAGRP